MASVVVQAGAYGASKVWEQIGLPGRMPTSGADAARQLKKIGKDEAEKLKRDVLEEMGLPPDLKITWPSELTAEGVKDAVYASGKGYLEKALEAKTGIPIKLPDKLTVKALERYFGDLFPSDAIEAINLALNIAVQVLVNALTTLLTTAAVAAGIGSIVPGIGTAVGFVVGLVVAGVRSLFTNAPTHPEGRACNYGSARDKEGKWHPQPPDNLDSFQFFAWATVTMKPYWDGLRLEQQTRACGRGGALDILRGLSYMRDAAFGMSLGTVDKLGLPALEAAIRAIQGAPDIVERPAAGAPFGQGAVTFVSGYAGIQPISQELRPIYDAKNRLLVAMRQRRTYLRALYEQGVGIPTLPARGNVAPQLRFKLVEELANAAVQVQNTASIEAVTWFAAIAGFVARLEKKQREATAADAAEAARGVAVANRKTCTQFFEAWAATDSRNRCLTSKDIERFFALCEQNLVGKLDGKTLRKQLEALVSKACARLEPKSEAIPTVVVEGTPGGALVRAFAFTGNPFRLFSRERRT